MSNIPPKVQTFLKDHDLSALEFEPGSTPTAETAAQRIGVPVGQIAKSILFKGKDEKFAYPGISTNGGFAGQGISR